MEVPNDATLKSAPEEAVMPVEYEDAIPPEQRFNEGDVPPMSEEEIARNEQEILDSMPLEPAPIEETGAYQAAHMLNVASFSSVTPEEVANDYNSGGRQMVEANKLGVHYEQSINLEADKSIVSNPNVPVERRVESLKRIQNPLMDMMELYQPILPRQFAQGLAHQEAVRYGSGGYANGGVDAQDAITKAFSEEAVPTLGTIEWNEYVNGTRDQVQAEKPDERIGWIQMGEKAETPAQVEAFIAGSAGYAEKTWKFWSSQGAKMLVPGSDQFYWDKVAPILHKNGIYPPKTSAIDPNSFLGNVTDYLMAGGWTQREYTEALKNASPAVRKKVAMDLLKLYDGKSGLDVYIAGMLTRMADGNPSVILDTIGTLAPIASGPGDLAVGVGLIGKTSRGAARVAKLPISVIAKKTPSATGDTMIRNAPQTSGDAMEAAAAGAVVPQKIFDVDEAEAAFHVSPSSTPFTDPSWMGVKAVINQTSRKAQRFIAEIDEVFGGYAKDLLARTPDDIISTISAHAKASGVAMLAKGASKVIKTEGGFNYEAVYRAADGNGFDSLKEAREASKAFGSKREVVTFAYENPLTGAKGELKPPPIKMEKEAAKKWREDMKALRSDPKIKWSIIRKGSVADDTPDELVFGKVGKELIERADGIKANLFHRFIDPNATATKDLHADLNKISGDHSRLNNLLNALWTGRSGVMGNPKTKDIAYVARLSRTEQGALAKGIRLAEEFETDGKILGRSSMIPLHQLEKIPGWNRHTTDAFVEYIHNTKVMYYVANVNLRRQAIVDGYKRYVSASTGKSVNAKAISRAEFTEDLVGSKASRKWAVGPEGKTVSIGLADMDRTMEAGATHKIVRLHQPFWAGKNWVTHQVLKVDDMVEEALPPFMLNAKSVYAPRIHQGTHVVIGKTDVGDWVAIGMAESSRFARQGAESIAKDPEQMKKYTEVAIREVRELSDKDGRLAKMDSVDGQLHGIIYGARNDDLAYWGTDTSTKGLLDPVESLFETTNKLAVGKKDSEIAFRRLYLTKAAQEEGLLDDTFTGIFVDQFEKLSTDPRKTARVKEYSDAFRNLNAMVEVNNEPARLWANGLGKVSRYMEEKAFAESGLTADAWEKAGAAVRYIRDENVNPLSLFQYWYTRLVISGKPLRQNIMQRASTLINVYRPQSFARGWWANSGLDSALSAMDEVLYTGSEAAQIQLKNAVTGFANRLGVSYDEAEALARHWRSMGGYDSISNHLYASTKYKILQNTQGDATRLVSTLRKADDMIYGTQSRIGFENGEKFAQRVAFMTEVAEDIAKGTASLKSKKYVQEAMARAADKTGNMRSEFRIAPGGGWLTLAAQFITYPTRMAMNTMPVALGGSMRFTKAEKIKIVLTQSALFGTVAWPIAEATEWALNNFVLEGNLTEEEIAQWQKISGPVKAGIFGEYAFNAMMESLTGEESNFDLSSTFGTTTGIDFVIDLVASSIDQPAIDVLLNNKLMEATRLPQVFSIGNMMFNRIFEGKLGDSDMMGAAMTTELASILLPSMDAGWLSYIAMSNDAMVSKAGTPTGEAYNSVKALLRYGMGIREADDAMLYKAMEKARLLEGKGGRAQQKSTAQKRADLIYKLIVNQVHAKRAMGNADLPPAEAMYNEIFSVYQGLIGYLPPDEIYDLREALVKKHEQAVSRKDLSEHAELTLGQALASSKAGVGETQDVYEWAELRFPQEDMSPGVRALMEKAKDNITRVDGYNKSGEQ